MAVYTLKVVGFRSIYCNMTDQDPDGLPEISSQELMLLIGRRMGLYE